MAAPCTDLSPWVDDARAALFTDLYELTMLRSYLEHGRTETAVFDLFVRGLPEERNVLVAAGLDSVLRYLETLRFTDEALGYLRSLDAFPAAFVERLRGFRFTGDVFAVPEGTPVFPGEPVLQIAAPLPEAQLVETFLINQIQLQTLMASKARRVVTAAEGRPVAEFGSRRAHGTDAGLKGARAAYLAGLAGTSNVAAGFAFGIPVLGTMAHSFVQAYEHEADAFADFAATFPETTLLVDTYDTLGGVERVVRLAESLGDRFRVRAVRLDSGDLAALARAARARLDAAGLSGVRIVASGGLDEWKVRDLVASGAPIDTFGVGTALVVSADAPSLEIVYKLAAYAGEGRMKLSPGKSTLPGRKQVFRVMEGGRAVRDVVALDGEDVPGEPLLRPVMRGGVRLDAGRVPLVEARRFAREAFDRLPPEIRALGPAPEPYPVHVSPGLAAERDAVEARLRAQRAVGA